MNVAGIISAILTSKFATLHELDTVYGSEDAYDMLEVIAVNSRNQAAAMNKSKGD